MITITLHAGDEWWSKLTQKQQMDYIKKHPKSRKAVEHRRKLEGNLKPIDDSEVEEDTPEVKEATAKVEKDLKDDVKYAGLKEKVGKFFDGDTSVGVNNIKVAACASAFIVALALAAAMPEHSDRIFNSAFVVGDLMIKSIESYHEGKEKDEGEEKGEEKDSEKKDVELLPEEEDQADERKRRLSEIGLDENGEPTKKGRSESKATAGYDTTKELVKLFMQVLKEK